MQSYQIPDIKDFMKKLLLLDTFDTFLLTEAAVTTFVTVQIDGIFYADYFSSDEPQAAEEAGGYVLWKRIRPIFFELIKGKRTPLSFRIVFRLAPHNVETLLRQSGLPLRPQDVGGFFLNVRYDGSSLICTSGSSLHFFTPDRSHEHAWDEVLQKFFRQKEIAFVCC